MSLSTLANTIWRIKEQPTIYAGEENLYYINFLVDGSLYQSLDIWGKGSPGEDANGLWYYSDSYTHVYCSDTLEWLNESYRTIYITGGGDADNEDLIAWLGDNAIQIEDLTGTSWHFNEEIDVSVIYDADGYDIDFTSDGYAGQSFTALWSTSKATSDQDLIYYVTYDDYEYSYAEEEGGWANESCRTIHITGGNDATDEELIWWLVNNATQIQPVATYTVTFNANGHGTGPSPITGVESGDTITEPSPAPTATGYTFGGWYKEQGCTNAWNFATDTVTQDTTLWAKWTAISYTITYNLDGGTATNPTLYNIETDSFTLNNPTKAGHQFDGWTGTELTEETLSVTVPIGSTGNRTYTANYTQLVQTYSVTFEMNGHGTNPGTQTVVEGETATQPANPTATGWTFGGWYADSSLTTAFDFSQAIYENKTVYAKWTAITQYTVSFNMMGHGQAIPSQTVNSGQTATEPTPPTNDGYEFKGWHSDPALTTAFDFATPITQNTTLYAKWYKPPTLNWNGNRHNEDYIFKRVEWPNFQEHESYDYITKGSVEYSTEADLKVTGSFDFEGYDVPDPNDLVRVYYSFQDNQGLTAYIPIATLFVNYASLNYEDTLKGIKASGSLEGSSVLKVLQDKIAALPYTVKKNDNAVYKAADIIKETGLQINLEVSGFVLSVDKTFDSGTTYLEIVNWLLTTAGYAEAYPDGNGIVQLVSTATIQNRAVKQTFKNDAQSIMYPEIDEANDWQETPNVVRLLYNTDDACIAAEAVNLTGSRASLDARGNREKTYYEEISDVGEGSKVTLLKELAEATLKEQSCDIEYVTMSHAYVPVSILDLIEIKYSDMNWSGLADNISIDLSPSTKTQTKIKRTLYEDIVITSSATVYRST